jgi:ABC-2 type transport system permease protein
MLAVVIVIVVALAIGFRPTTGPLAWVAAFGLLGLTALALTWVALGLGLFANSVDSASNLPLPLTLLPFFGSGFVPTDSMPEPLRWFADNQPFTPIIETVRRLLLGGEIGGRGLIALAWCIAITVVGYLWSRKLYERDPAR